MHTLILLSMTSSLCLLNLPTILCTISYELIELSLQRLPKILLMPMCYILPVLMPFSLLYFPSMESIRCLLNISQQELEAQIEVRELSMIRHQKIRRRLRNHMVTLKEEEFPKEDHLVGEIIFLEKEEEVEEVK
jgi:hypothetical protein